MAADGRYLLDLKTLGNRQLHIYGVFISLYWLGGPKLLLLCFIALCEEIRVKLLPVAIREELGVHLTVFRPISVDLHRSLNDELLFDALHVLVLKVLRWLSD